MTLSAVLIVKNEEEKLSRCLTSLSNIVDEIIIVDTGSTDNTLTIAKNFTKKIFHFAWNNSFSDARNYSLSKSSGDFNLIIDADEYITIFNSTKITEFINSKDHLGIITQKNKVEQNGESFFQPDYITRLLPKGTKFTGNIHEQVDSNLPRKIVPIEVTHDGYFHRSNDKFHRNINLLLEELSLYPNNAYVLYQLAIEYFGLKNHAKAKVFFEKCYTIITSTNSIFPQFITSYIAFCKETKDYKTCLTIIQEQEVHLENYPDFYFESGGFYLDYVLSDIEHNLDYIGIIETCYLACLEIGDIKTHSSLIGTGSFLAQYNLGVYYETTQQFEKAKSYYLKAKNNHYVPAIRRFNALTNKSNK